MADGARRDGGGTRPPSPPGLTCTVSFCPICIAVTTVSEAKPELIEHLMLAGHELLLAARAVIDARLQNIEGEEGKERPARVKRITIE